MSDTASITPVAELQEALRQGSSLGGRIRNGLSRRGDADARAAAARLLGMKPSEIASVVDTPAGPVIATTDGQRYIAIPDDRPDAEGKTGLAFLQPTACPTTNSGFRVYAPHQGDPPLVAPASLEAEVEDPAEPAEPSGVETFTNRADVDRRLVAIAAILDQLVEARAKATTVDELDAIDRRRRALENEALVLRNRRPDVARAEAAASEQRDRERRAGIERREAELLAEAAPIFERIRAAHVELDVIREQAIAGGIGEHWRDRAKLPRGAFGEFSGPAHPGLDLLDGFAEWHRTGESPIKFVRPATVATATGAATEVDPRQVPTIGPAHPSWR